MTKTKARLEQAHQHSASAAGILATAVAREKASRMELHNAVLKLKNSILLVESVLNAQD